MKIIRARGKELGKVVRTLGAGPVASLRKEGEAARRELMRTEWLLSCCVLQGFAEACRLSLR